MYIPSDSGHTPYRSQDKGVNHMSRQKEIPDLDTLSREERMKYGGNNQGFVFKIHFTQSLPKGIVLAVWMLSMGFVQQFVILTI